MINSKLLDKLKVITDEEQKILSGGMDIERNLYMQTPLNVVSSQKLLEAGKLITVRPHTRFIKFPEHSHDFVEMVYMCSGTTTHIVNGKKVTLEEGELLILCQSAVQEIMPAETDDIAVNFIIIPKFFDDVIKFLGEENTPLREFLIDTIKGNNSETAYLHFKVSEVLLIQNLIENLIYNFLHKVANKRNINQKTMALLFLQLINHTDKLEYYEQDKTVVKVHRYIEDNYKNGSLSNLCKTLYCDIYSLSREIKKKTGKTYTELVQDLRGRGVDVRVNALFLFYLFFYTKKWKGVQVCNVFALSKEDDSITVASNSILNQEKMISMYIDVHYDLVFKKKYIDDGVSGSSFERPGFNKIMEDVEAEKN